MKAFLKTPFLLSLILLSSQCVADIISPMAPPELSDTLKDFRTKEQLKEREIIEFGDATYQMVDIEDIPVVPGDNASGVLRLSGPYMANENITIPQYGSAIVRFYDMQGTPWDIVNIDLENQGYIAKVTAAPSELYIKQLQGASTTTMIVHLANLMQPLVFNLTPLSLVNSKKPIKTVLTSIKVNYINDKVQKRDIKKVVFAKKNPFEPEISFDDVSFDLVEKNLIEALRELK